MLCYVNGLNKAFILHTPLTSAYNGIELLLYPQLKLHLKLGLGVSFRNCSCICIVWPVLQGRVGLCFQSWAALQILGIKLGWILVETTLLCIVFCIFRFCIWILVEATLSMAQVSLLLWLKGLSPPGNSFVYYILYFRGFKGLSPCWQHLKEMRPPYKLSALCCKQSQKGKVGG